MSGSTELRFDGQVAIVTGAGGGLGRQYALDLAARGARVLVNDLGCAPTGDGGSASPSESVVTEIRATGGEAIASHVDVAAPGAGEEMVAACIDEWGRVDVVINNAGIVRPGNVEEVGREAFESVLGVHVHGSISVAAAAWPHMAAAGYGRIVNTSSNSVFGSGHVATYVTAKSALIGLTKVEAFEGQRVGIKVNAVMPAAFSRLTAQIPNEALVQVLDERFQPDTVSPVVLLLAHADVPCSGDVFIAGGGHVAKVALGIAQGAVDALTPEAVRDAWPEVVDLEGAVFPPTNAEATAFQLSRALGSEFGADLASVNRARP